MAQFKCSVFYVYELWSFPGTPLEEGLVRQKHVGVFAACNQYKTID
jgi:hypothetical protein